MAKKCINAIVESRRNYQDFHDQDMEATNAKIIACLIGDVDSYIRTPAEITTP